MKITWFFGLLCMAMTIFLVGYNIHMQKKFVLQEARSDAFNLANLVETDLVRTFSGIDQIFMGLGNHLHHESSGHTIDPPEIRRIIDDLVLQNNFLTALMVLDPRGQILHWNNNFQKPNLSQRPYFQVHRSVPIEGLFFGPPQPSIINQGQWVAGVSKAVRHNNRSLALVLAAIIDLKYFENRYRALLATPGTAVQIMTPDGYLYAHIAHPDSPRISEPPAPGTQVPVNSFMDQEFITSKTVADYPLQVKIIQDESAILAAWETNTQMFVTLGAVVSLILLVMTWRTALAQRRQIELKAEVFERSGIDPLTRLTSSERAFTQAKLEIKKAVRKKSPLAVILINPDHFKTLNETYGRQLGDEVLKGTAGILRECSRETDIVSRYSGANFLLLLPDTNLQGAVVLARKIHERLAKKSYPVPKGEFQVTASFGVSEWAAEEKDIEPAVQRAGAALYEVKKSGRNNIRWMPSGLSNKGIEESVVWLHTKDRYS